jgi:photosystem II stability/assembly factor-like uncharacterized protein
LRNDQGLYRSSDGGRHWEPINEGLRSRKVNSIAASFFESSLYAATDAGLWVSNDRGNTWREDPDFRCKPLLSVAVSSHDPKILLISDYTLLGVSGVSMSSGAAVMTDSDSMDVEKLEGLEGNGLKISRDGGKTWTTFPTRKNINDLYLDPEDSRVFAAVSASDGLFFSRHGPEKLQPVETFPQGQKPVCVTLLPGDPDRLLVGTMHGGLYWSNDDGASWERGSGIPDVQVSDIKFLAEASSRIAAATPCGPFESDDGGTRWRRSAKGLDYDCGMTLAPLTDGSIILGTRGGGAYRRAAGRSTWNPSSEGFPPAFALRLGQAGGWLLAGTIGLLRSPDGGTSWRYSGLVGEQVVEIAVAPESTGDDPHSLMEQGGLFVRRAGLGPPKLIVSRDDSPIEIVIGTDKGELFRSPDSGASWEPLATGFWRHGNIRSITLSSGTPRRIGVLVEPSGFFISDDGGQNWSAEASDFLGRRPIGLVASRHDDRKLFALTADRGAFLSDDGAATWTQCGGFPSDETFVAIAEPEDDAGVVFAASLLCSVYRSIDGGRKFSKIDCIDPPTDIDPGKVTSTTLVVRPRPDGPATFVLGSSLGAHLSQDEGRTWKPLLAGILKHNYWVNDLLLTDRGTRILMATNKGIFSQELPP